MTEERLDGHDQIRKYIDPRMSRSYYFKKVRPKIEAVLMTRTYGRTNQTKIFTYKNLLISRILEITKI